MSDSETFALDYTEILSYREYKQECIHTKKPFKLFSEWYKEKYGKEIPSFLQTRLNKGLSRTN